MKEIKGLFACFFLSAIFLVSCSAASIENHESERSEWISPIEQVDIDDMNLFWGADNIQFSGDENAKLSLYVQAEQNEDGEFLFDDGQDWALVMETSLGNYPLFPRRRVQLGGVSCAAFNEYINDDIVSHVLVTVHAGAGYQIYDCVFDDSKNAFEKLLVYSADGINLTAVSGN